jgi:hypothetical protein
LNLYHHHVIVYSLIISDYLFFKNLNILCIFSERFFSRFRFLGSTDLMTGSVLVTLVETGSLLGHLLPGSIYSDEDALLIGRDDHSMCLDTSVWDPGADDINRVSAHEDTTAHTGYGAIQIGVVVGDGMQWHTGGLSSTRDSGQFNALYFEECVVGDSIVDTSSERHEVAPQQDCDQKSRHLAGQLRVSEDMIMAATRCIDDTHALVAGYCWRTSMAQDSSDGGLVIDDFHTLRERVIVMRANY